MSSSFAFSSDSSHNTHTHTHTHTQTHTQTHTKTHTYHTYASSFYEDSEKYGGVTSNPITHGFDHFNATIEVTPTATTNCNCKGGDWNSSSCDYGHYKVPTHCAPAGKCCFNYWWEDNTAPHGVTNLTNAVGEDDSAYIADSFTRFVESLDGTPFFAQLSFHNCHIPFIGSKEARASCAAGQTCKPGQYSDAQLDYYACLNELDASVGKVLAALQQNGYRDNTMVWLTTDNGPEGNCKPEGICNATWYEDNPGSAGPLRGRKRDIYEGGHRVPGIISWPAVVKGNRVSNDTLVTSDFLPTVLEVLGVQRPASQLSWGFDGVSALSFIEGKENMPERGIGWAYATTAAEGKNPSQFGYRYGKWKYVHGSVSCADAACNEPKLFDLSVDLGETKNLATEHPDVFSAIKANYTAWFASVQRSFTVENECKF